MENTFTPRKYRGPETWALVRDAYLAGEPARLVAARFDVNWQSLRKKAYLEGWTRKAHACATDYAAHRRVRAPERPASAAEPPAPVLSSEDAVRRAVQAAAAALADGRPAEALATLRAAEALSRIAGLTPPPAPDPDPDWPDWFVPGNPRFEELEDQIGAKLEAALRLTA